MTRLVPTSCTLRQLNSKQFSLPDAEHYKLIDIKEDPLSNKFKYLDVLCFPTLFATGRFGKSHSCQQHIILSEFVKSPQGQAFPHGRPVCLLSPLAEGDVRTC